jgi:hypothetical protein
MCRKVVLSFALLGICASTAAAAGGTAAKNPDPKNGAVGVTMPLLKWTKGDLALFHNVYLGTTPDLTEANLVASRQPFEMYYHTAGFTPGATYYWRVDEIEMDGVTIHPGNVWSFVVQDVKAYYPSPTDGATNVPLASTLTWMPGTGATKHHLYFSASQDAVSQGSADADMGMLDLDVTKFDVNDLENLATYYWRVDEVLSDQTVKTGPVWKFTTFIVVDDFESYTDDEGTRIYETWTDGWTNNTGSRVGHLEAPFAEVLTIHGGKQAMPLDYNNLAAPFCSEAEQVWATPQDWSGAGVSTLTLYFRGTSANKVDRLYVSITDKSGKVGTSVCPTSSRIAMPAWTRWEIPLSDFSAAGVNLAAVKKIVIGLGDRDSAKAGGVGVLYLDDIYVGGLGAALTETALFAEDFEGLVLGPNQDESLKNDHAWTKEAPPGWVHDDTKVPGIGTATDGVTEWAGWSFTNRLWWVEAAADQDRSQFTKGVGTIAVADDDEWDDQDHGGWAAGYYTTYLSTPAIDISTAKAGTLKLKFDSAWKPECFDDGPGTNNQTAQVTVSYDGAKAVEVLRWQSDSGSPYYHGNATNETVVLALDAPAGAKTMVLTFGLLNAGNDWWWSFDNVEVTAAPK